MIHRDEYLSGAQHAADKLASAGIAPVDVVLQCGSGLAELAELLLPEAIRLPLADLPRMPAPRVAGHGQEAVYGRCGSANLLVLTGRLHIYEGHSPEVAAYPAAVAQAAGAKLLLITNAAGGLNQHYRVGELMLHTDFINFQGDNALAHIRTDNSAERFVDPKPAYEPEASALLGRRLSAAGARVHEGVYVGVRGPLYETRAELAMLRSFGADAIGMSTVPEVTLCQFLRLPVVGVSVITNECFGSSPVSHDEVVSGCQAAIPLLASGVRAFLEQPTA